MQTQPLTTTRSSDSHSKSSQAMPTDNSLNILLCQHVEHAVRQYFNKLDGSQPHNLYNIILSEIEKPLLKVVLEQTNGNQTKCADILGLNRGTLRKKMAQYNL